MLVSQGYVDNENGIYFLNKNHDAAYYHLRGGWRMLGEKEIKKVHDKVGDDNIKTMCYDNNDGACDCPDHYGSVIIGGRPIAYQLVNSNGKPWIRLPMAGAISGENLACIFDNHFSYATSASLISSYTWSRDYAGDGMAYYYGFSQDKKTPIGIFKIRHQMNNLLT